MAGHTNTRPPGTNSGLLRQHPTRTNFPTYPRKDQISLFVPVVLYSLCFLEGNKNRKQGRLSALRPCCIIWVSWSRSWLPVGGVAHLSWIRYHRDGGGAGADGGGGVIMFFLCFYFGPSGNLQSGHFRKIHTLCPKQNGVGSGALHDADNFEDSRVTQIG